MRGLATLALLTALLQSAASAPPAAPSNYSTPYNFVNTTHNNIPTLPSDCTLRIVFGQRLITSLGSLSTKFSLKHGGVTFLPDCPSESVPAAISFEYWGLSFPFGVLFPVVHPGSLPVWQDHAVVTWEACRSALMSQLPNSTTLGLCVSQPWAYEVDMGTMSGAQFNRFRGWFPAYAADYLRYELFDVWDKSVLDNSTQRWVNASTCVTFAEAVLVAAHEAGAVMDDPQPRALLRRNYVPLVAAAAPTVVNVSSAAEVASLNTFFGALVELEHTFQQKAPAGGVWALVEAVWEALGSRVWYTYDGTYRRVRLREGPLAALRHHDVDQAMNLPWLA